MRYAEVLTEMAFDRKRIIRALESYDARIFEHAVKLIVLPESRDVPHWKQEILAWAGYLASLRIKTKGTPPMGVPLAYQYLYEGPFVGNEIGMTAHFIRMAEVAHRTKLDVDPSSVHDRLKAFLIALAQEIGTGGNVEPVVESLVKHH
jgi:hypothetical protein